MSHLATTNEAEKFKQHIRQELASRARPTDEVRGLCCVDPKTIKNGNLSYPGGALAHFISERGKLSYDRVCRYLARQKQIGGIPKKGLPIVLHRRCGFAFVMGYESLEAQDALIAEVIKAVLKASDEVGIEVIITIQSAGSAPCK